MPASGKVKTTTEIVYKNDGTVDIILKAVKKSDEECSTLLPHIIRSFITGVPIVISGGTIVEGFLLIDASCYPEWIDIDLDDNTGELFVSFKNPLESEYRIDRNTGNLLFDKE